MNALPATLQALGLPAQYLILFAALCGVAAAIMPWLPRPAAGGLYALIYGVLNFAAHNYGNATNRSVAPAPVASVPNVSTPSLGAALLIAPALGAMLLLSACATSTVTPASIISQAVAVTGGLDTAITEIAAANPTLIPPATLAKIQTDLALAKTAAAGLAAGAPATQGAGTVATVEGYVNDVLNVLAAPPINGLIPAPANEAVAAAAIVVPVLESFVAQYLPAASAPAPEVVQARVVLAGAVPQVTTLQQATAILQGFAALKH